LELGVIRSGGENQENRNEEEVNRGDVKCRGHTVQMLDRGREGRCDDERDLWQVRRGEWWAGALGGGKGVG